MSSVTLAHPLLDREGLLERPGRDLPRGELADDAAEAPHGAVVEGGHDQRPVAPVLGAVEQEQRAVAEHRAEDPVRRPHPHHLRVAGQHRPGEAGVGDEGAAAERAEADREDLAVASRLRSMKRTGSRNHCSDWTRPGRREPGGTSGSPASPRTRMLRSRDRIGTHLRRSPD